MSELFKPSRMSRRGLMQLGGAAVFVSVVPSPASATPQSMLVAQRELFGDRPIQDARVNLDLPPISENGYSVPLTVSVESEMTPDDYVQQIAIFSPRNPLANIIRFKLGPRAGKAEVSARVRLGGTQTLEAIAEMNDGSLWRGRAETVVTLAACVVL